MCSNSYYKESPTTKEQMVYCKLFDEKEKDLEQICLYQRYCTDLGKYINTDQCKCKNYKL
jgi:hypothetical protein